MPRPRPTGMKLRRPRLGPQRSIRWRKPTTITRATRDSRVVFTKDASHSNSRQTEDNDADGPQHADRRQRRPRTRAEQRRLGGCQTGSGIVGGRRTPSVERVDGGAAEAIVSPGLLVACIPVTSSTRLRVIIKVTGLGNRSARPVAAILLFVRNAGHVLPRHPRCAMLRVS